MGFYHVFKTIDFLTKTDKVYPIEKCNFSHFLNLLYFIVEFLNIFENLRHQKIDIRKRLHLLVFDYIKYLDDNLH